MTDKLTGVHVCTCILKRLFSCLTKLLLTVLCNSHARNNLQHINIATDLSSNLWTYNNGCWTGFKNSCEPRNLEGFIGPITRSVAHGPVHDMACSPVKIFCRFFIGGHMEPKINSKFKRQCQVNIRTCWSMILYQLLSPCMLSFLQLTAKYWQKKRSGWNPIKFITVNLDTILNLTPCNLLEMQNQNSKTSLLSTIIIYYFWELGGTLRQVDFPSWWYSDLWSLLN